jgi:hypothetical protein
LHRTEDQSATIDAGTPGNAGGLGFQDQCNQPLCHLSELLPCLLHRTEDQSATIDAGTPGNAGRLGPRILLAAGPSFNIRLEKAPGSHQVLNLPRTGEPSGRLRVREYIRPVQISEEFPCAHRN